MLPPTTNWQDKRVTIMGLGSFGGGVGLAQYLVGQGADVTVTDLRRADDLQASLQALAGLSIRFVFGEHRQRDFTQPDVVFVNPAVPPTSPYLKLARAHHIPLDSEINLFVRLCPGQIIGVTGSVGKSTTTALLGTILHLHDHRTLVGGNIGRSLLPCLPDITPDTPVVLELSSFQLEQLAWLRYSPPLALVLNLAPNHLDRHGTMAAYQEAKEHILAYQTPAHTAILNWDDPCVRAMATRGDGKRLYYSLAATLDEGAVWQNAHLVLSRSGRRKVLFKASDLHLRGAHNIGNAAAAATAAALFGASPDTIAQGLHEFTGLPHRLELVATRHGVAYYNDSKATTPVSTIGALQAFDQPVILLAGGYDKGAPFSELGQVIHACAKAALIYGKTAPKLALAIDEASCSPVKQTTPSVQQLADLDTALHEAIALAEPGDAVVLSPACASYDQFPHFEARGDHFRQLVLALP